MKKFLFLSFILFCLPVQAGLYDDILAPEDMPKENKQIFYGYNAEGDYVPTAIGEQKIEYGYDAYGDFVPKAIGGQKIKYGYNAYGEYVPVSIED